MNDITKSSLSDSSSIDQLPSIYSNSDDLCKSYIYKGYHTGRICSLALTTLKDGRKIAASASHDRTVRIWDLNDKSEIRKFNLPDFVSRVFLVIGTNSRSYVVCYIFALCNIHVYDVLSGEKISQFNGRLIFSGNVAFYRTPVVITVIGDNGISIIDLETGQVIRTWTGGFSKVFRAVVSHGLCPIFVYIAWNSHTKRSSIQSYDLSCEEDSYEMNVAGITHRILPKSTKRGERHTDINRIHTLFIGDSKDGVTCLVISRGTIPVICSGHYDFKVRVWNLKTRELKYCLEGHSDFVLSVAIWKGPEKFVISGSSDSSIKVWDYISGDLVRTITGHSKDVWSVTCTTGPYPIIVSGGTDRSVRLWDMSEFIICREKQKLLNITNSTPSNVEETHSFEGHTGRIYSIAQCTLEDGRVIAASASHDRTVRIWNINSQKLLQILKYSDFVWRVSLVISYGKPLVISFVSALGIIYISDALTGEQKRQLNGRLIMAGYVAFYRTPIVILAQGDNGISIIDVETGQVIRTWIGGFSKVFRAVVSHGLCPILVFTTWNSKTRRSTIQAHDLSEDELIYQTEKFTEKYYADMNYSNQKYQRPSCCYRVLCKNSIRGERNTNIQKIKLIFEGDSKDGVTSVVLSHGDTPVICSGHYDFKVRVWDLTSRALLFILEGHTDSVLSVAIWKGNDNIVVSGSADDTLNIWDFKTGEMIAVCEGHSRDVWSICTTSSVPPLIVSASTDRSVRSWDINPIIRQRKWERRRYFCLFLHGYDFIDKSMIGLINCTNSIKSSTCDADNKKLKIIQHTTIQTSIQSNKPNSITLDELLSQKYSEVKEVKEIKEINVDEKKEEDTIKQIMINDIQHKLHRAYIQEHYFGLDIAQCPEYQQYCIDMTKEELKQLKVLTERVILLPSIISLKQQLLSSVHHQHYHHPNYHNSLRKENSSSLSDLLNTFAVIDNDIDKHILPASSQEISLLTNLSNSLSTDINQSYAILSTIPDLTNQDNILLETIDSMIYKNTIQIVDLLLIPRVSKSKIAMLIVFRTFFCVVKLYHFYNYNVKNLYK